MRVLNFIKSKLLTAFYSIAAFIATHKITSAVIVAVIAGVVATAIIVTNILSAPVKLILSSNNSDTVSVNSTISDVIVSDTEEPTSSEDASTESEETPSSSEETNSSSKVESTTPPNSNMTPNTDFNYNSNMSYDNNVFLDALKYTGYKTDPAMWGSYGNYVLCSQKRGRGWLSNITYDDYGRSKGYETTANGLPDIHYFEQKGLVCASYVAYVYFNYLPNVAGIDTSMLPKAENPVLANDWYRAAKKWVNAGYSRYIDFTANDNGSIYQDLKLSVNEEIPIGSLIFLCDWYNRTDWSTHVSIYAGKVNGYHWVTHVGNENGPELCAIERMNRLPHPQWMLAIVTPPSNIRFSPAIEVTVKDQEGNPMKDVEISVKSSNGTVTNLGKTDAQGKVNKEGFSYDKYEITQKTPAGYTCTSSVQTISLTSKNNSLNTISFVNTKAEETSEDNLNSSEDTESIDGENNLQENDATQ